MNSWAGVPEGSVTAPEAHGKSLDPHSAPLAIDHSIYQTSDLLGVNLAEQEQARLLQRLASRRQRRRLDHQAQVREHEIGSRAVQLLHRRNMRHHFRMPLAR